MSPAVHSDLFATPAANRPAAARPSLEQKQALSRLPLSFEANQGQTSNQVRFLSRGAAYNLFLTDAGAVLELEHRQAPREIRRVGNKPMVETSAPPDWLGIRLEKAGASVAVSGEAELPGKSNYFIGKDPQKWRRGIPNYARVRYHNVYPGIDLLYYGNQGHLEYDFIVAPGARAEQIGLLIDGGEKLELSASGDLVIPVGGNALRLEKPRLYQEIEGARREIAGGYLLENGRVKFRVGHYDRRQPLIIDPVLTFSTFFGGSGNELFILNNIDGAITLDSNGNIYVAGETQSPSFAFPGFPPGGYKSTCGSDGACNVSTGGSDVFIAKLNPAGSAVLAFTYVGGSGRDILALNSTSGGLIVDSTGVYISGTTYSSDFPTTTGVFQPSCTSAACTGNGDGFVTKLDVNLASLTFSTYLSGTGTSQAGQMQVDSQGNVYVIGQAESGYQASGTLTPCVPANNCLTGFVTELNSTGTGQVFSDFLGGSGQDYVDALALDTNNNIYVVGQTTSTDFPGTKTLLPAATSGGVFSSTNGTSWTALNTGLTGLNVQGLAVNPTNGQVLVAGTIQGVFQTTNGGTSWTKVFAANGTAIAFDPLNTQTVYAGTGDGINGLLKSTNGGSTWSSITTIPSYFMSAVAVDPNNEGTLYVGTQGGGVWKSTNGGSSWTQIQTSSGLAGVLVNAIVIDYTNSAIVYAGTMDQGIFVSTNGGANWTQANNGLVTSNGSTATDRTLAIDPNTHTTLYAGTNSGVFKSTNSAGTWTAVNSGLSVGIATATIRTIAVDPANSQNVYGGSGSAGLFFSSNGGGTWSLLNNLGPHSVNVLALFPAASLPTTVYAGTSYEFAFAAKINFGGGSLAYATLLGGNSPTYLWGIALDSSNNAYVGGQTYASNFPVSGSAFQKNLLGNTTGVVAKLNSSGNALSYASYLGGSGSDAAYAIAVDGNQQAWLTGVTTSNDFPLANAVWLQSPSNSQEGFVTQFNPTGTGLSFSTYLGGEGNCQNNCNGPVSSAGVDLTLDSSGDAYVIGFTNDESFVTANALQSSLAGGYDAFVTKIGAVATVTDLSICLLNSSGQCTTTPPPAVPAGEDFVLSLQVTNKSATTPATGVVVGGRGGNGVKAVDCSTSVGTCEADNSNGQIPNGGFYSLGTLAAGASAQITVTLVGTQAGTFTVEVDVRENETDANPADNSASTTLTILPGADLAVDMNVSPASPQVGSVLTYTANATNAGPSNASNVTAVFAFSPATAATFGTLPSGCSNTAQGTLTCTIGPLAAGASSPGTITATAVSLPLEATITVSNTPEADPDPANNTLTLISGANTAGANNAELNGHYAFMLHGFDPSGNAIVIGGSFAADGAGNVTGGVMDINDAGSTPCSPASCPLTINPAPASFYSVGADNRGQLTLNTSAGTQTFDFAVGGVGTITAGIASLGHIISRQTSSPNGSAIGGVFKLQNPTAITALPTGDWAFLDEGVDQNGNRFVAAGRFTLSGINLTQGTEDFNDAGIFDSGTTTAVTFTGTFGTLDTTNGRVPLSTVTTSGGPLSDVAVYIVSSTEALFASTDAVSVNPLAGGSALRQDTTTWCPTTGNCAFTNNALNGNAVVYLQGTASSVAGGSKVQVGSLTFAPGSPTGTISGGLDKNDGGTISTPSDNGTDGSFSVAANGRVTLTGGGGSSPTFYMVNTNQAFLVGSSSDGLGGAAEPQVGPIQLTTGSHAIGTDVPAVSAASVDDEVQVVTAGSSSFAIATSNTGDGNGVSGGLQEGVALANFEITDLNQLSGRYTFLDGASGAKPMVGYFVNPNRRIVINADPNSTAPTISFSDIQTGGSSVQPDLAVSIAASPSSSVVPGASITYTISVTNLLSTPATGAVLATSFTPSLTVNSVTTSQGTCAGGLPASLNSLSCTLGTVTQGTNITVTIVAVAPASGSTCANSALGCILAAATVTEDQTDFNTANNTAAVTTPVVSTSATTCTGTTTNWVGGNGNWSDAAMWSTGVVPNSTSVNVCIANGGPASQVTLDISASVDNLYIDSGSSLTVSNNTTFIVAGNISNAGQISVSAGANTTTLQVAGGHNLLLSGGGTLTLSSSGGTVLINQSSGGATLTNVDNTIQGLGQIGNNGLALVNQAGATVNANSGGVLALNGGAITNAGLIEATAGGTLQTNETINNTGGTLAATGANSSLQLMSGTTVQGGTLNASGGGTLGSANGQTITLDGTTQGALTNAGTYTVANNSTTILSGTITNSGAIQVAAAGNTTLLQIAGGQNTTLTGGGTLTLSTTGGAVVINQTSGGATLTNANNIIQGQGEIGNNGLALVNGTGGTINANAAGTLTIDASPVTNQNLMEATGGGTLAINTTTVNNNGSTILASAGTVQFTNATIQGGTLNTLNNGVLGPATGQTVTLDGISTHQGTLNIGGTFTIPNNSDAILEGTINNGGAILLSAGANTTLLQIAGGQNITLTGAGTLTMSSSAGGAPIINQTSGGATLTNANNIIQGQGEIGNNGLALVNSGIINANVSGKTLTVDTGSLANNDTLEATGGGTLSLVNSTINNQSGSIHADGSGSQVQFMSGVTIESGTLVTTNSGLLGTAAGTSVTLDGSTLGQPITLSGTYTAANNSVTTLVGTVNNTGSFLLSATVNTTLLQIAGGKNVILGGGGTLTMSSSGGGTPVINQTSGGATLTNTNNTIQGQGEIGNNGLVLINQATINANVAGQTLTIDATTPTNVGLEEATNGATLSLSNDVVNNQGGTILVNGATSAVQFVSNATIQGGTLSTANGGLMQTAPGSGMTLDGSTHGGLTNAGTFIIPNNSTTTLLGTINNTGAILLNAVGNTTELQIAGGTNVTLTGAGSVTLSTSGAGLPVINQTSGGSTLTNVNNLIQGQGQIGNNGLALVNQTGTIYANAAGPLLLNSPVTNQSLIEAIGGGTLQVNTTVSSPGGMIAAAGAGSSVQFLSGANIQGGTLTTSGGGAMGTVNGNTVTLNGSTGAGPVTNTGTYIGGDNSATVLSGTINNTGNIQISAVNDNTFLQIAGGQSVTLAGAGTVTLSTTGSGTAFINQTSGSATLVNAGNTIQGTGQIGNNGLAISNQGTITANISGAGAFTQSAGSLVVPASTTDSPTSASISGGTAQVDGTLTGGVTVSDTGTLIGSGTVSGGVSNGGAVQPGDSPGILTVNGNYTQSSAGALNIPIGGTSVGTQFSQLSVPGTASLGGTLNVTLINGFTPASGTPFTILTAGSVSGTFATVNLPSASWQIAYNATSVVVTAETTGNNPVPVISSISPTSATTGGAGFTLTVNGPVTSGSGNMTVLATDVIYAAGNQSALASTIGGTVPNAITLPSLASYITFSSVTGSLTDGCSSPEGCITLDGGGALNDPDGNFAAVSSSSNTGSGSISGVTLAGAGSLVGVFIAAGGPSGTAPAALNFTSSGLGTAFTTLSPQLDQVFFIGDGLTGDGTGTTQTFNVPLGATQLYLGISDAGGFNGPPGSYGDNSGSYSVAYNVATASAADFVNGSTVDFNGSAVPTTFVNQSQLTAAVPASAIAASGSYNVTVVNPAPGGGTSNAVPFPVNNPAPVIASLSPSSATAGGAGFTLTVNGTPSASNNVTVLATDVIYAAGTQSALATSSGVGGTVPGAINLAPQTSFVTVSNVTGSITSGCASAEGCITLNSGTPNDPDGTGAAAASSSTTGSGSISGITAPGAGYLVGVFIAAGGPSGTAPAALDFTSGIGTAFTTLSPLLNQVFFIGDGLTGDGTGTVQTFAVPPGATQLYLGISDAAGYNGAPGSYQNNAGSYTLTVNDGADFVPGATVSFNGSARTTNFVSTTELTADILASDIAAAGNSDVTVTNPAPGGGTSAPAIFVSTSPQAPTVTSISPTSATAGGAAFTLTVNGTNFISTSVVNFGADTPPTTFVSATELTAVVPASDIATGGTVNVSVTTPSGGGTSNAVTFTVNNPTPAITTISPTAVTAGSGQFTLTVNGTGFVSSSAVIFGSTNPVTTIVSSTQLTALIPASAITTAGNVNVTVISPSPGGGTSNAATFTVNAASGTTVYSTGFENPPFTLGNLAGQDGWQVAAACSPGLSATVLVENTLVQSGLQAVSVNDTAGCQSGPYHNDSSAGPLVELSAGIYISSSSSQSAWQFAGMGPGELPSSPLYIGGINILGTGEIDSITSGFPKIGTWTYNAWNNLDFLFNFTTQTYTISLNGVTLASAVPFNATASSYAMSFFDSFGNGPGTDTGYMDNFSVSAPTSAGTDMAVSMTASPSPTPVLGSVTYQITVSNNGPNPATGVVLTDPIPANTVFASIDDLTDCAVVSGTLTCNFGSLGVGSSDIVNLMLVPLAVPAGAGTFANTATVAANESDPNPANNTATQTVQVTGTNLPNGGAFRSQPGFSTNIFAPNDDNSAGPVPMNLNLNFFGLQVSTIFVNNNGNVTFNAALPDFTPFPLSTTEVPIIAPFFADVDTTFAPSGLVTYGNDTVSGRPAFGVNFPNVEYYGEVGDETSLLDIFQVVLIDRTDVAAGDFDIEFNYDKIQWETGDASGGMDGLGGSSARVGYANGSEAAGSYFELPGSGVPGSFLDTNTSSGLIYNMLNNTQPGRYLFQVRGGTVQSSADMAMSASGPQSAATGSTITYTLTATNLGPNAATGVIVTNTLPAGFTFVSAAPAGICTAAGQPVVVTCSVGTVADGANAIITIQAGVPTTASGTVTDTAVVSVPNNQDLNQANNTATVMTTISVVTPDLTIAKSHADPFAQGQVGAIYTITVSNVGSGPTTAAVNVNDAVPSGLTATAIGGTGWTCTTLTSCTRVDALAAGASYPPITLSVNVATSAPAQVTNTATVSGGGEVNTSNDTANDLTNITAQAADLNVSVAVAPASPTSTAVGYAVTAVNNGPSAASSVMVTDQLIGNASFASATSPTMNCTMSASSVACTQATLDNGASAVVNITVNLTGTGWDGNTVHITSATPDPNPLNNTAQVQKLSAGGNTVTGANVAVEPVDSTTGASPAVVTFANVTRGGTTSIASSANGSAPPAGYRTGTPAVFYNISTTAGYTGAISVVLGFNGVSFHHPANVRLFHFEGSAWVDRTVALNIAAGYAAAQVTSLSPFALFEPVNIAPEAKAGPGISTAATSAQGAKITLNGSASTDPDHNPLTYLWTGPFPEGNGTATGVSPTVTMPAGANTVTLVVNNGESSSAPSPELITVTDFRLAVAASGPTTVSAGGALKFSVSANQQFGPFAPAITLACSGLPQGAACSFSSATVNAGGTASALTITTTARSTAALAPTRRGNHAPFYALWMPLPAILLMGAGTRRRGRKHAALLMLLLLIGMMLVLASCGGGGMGPTPVVSNGTPANNYNVTVTGTTSSGLQHTTTVSFTVQ